MLLKISSVATADWTDLSSNLAIGRESSRKSKVLGVTLRIRSQRTNGRVARTIHCVLNLQPGGLWGAYQAVQTYMMVR